MAKLDSAHAQSIEFVLIRVRRMRSIQYGAIFNCISG